MIEHVEAWGIEWAGKMVRGAYMDHGYARSQIHAGEQTIPVIIHRKADWEKVEALLMDVAKGIAPDEWTGRARELGFGA